MYQNTAGPSPYRQALRLAALLIATLLTLCCAVAASPGWGNSLDDTIRDDLRATQVVSDISGGEPLRMSGALADFYAGRGNTTGWIVDGRPSHAAYAMLAAVRDAADEGLRPEDYHEQALASLLSALRISFLPTERRRQRLAALELLLSDAFMLLAEHEANGRVNPAGMNPLISSDTRPPDFNGNLQAVMQGAEPEVVLRGLAPQDAGYAALRDALAHYRNLAAQGELPPVAAGPPLTLGDSGPRVAALIARLENEGDLAKDESLSSSFGPEVQAALSRFQARHGLNGHGVATAATLLALNEPMQTRVDQLRVNLERRRWLPDGIPATRLVVNIADFRATFYQDDQPVLSEPVVVGQPYRQTPEFSDRIRYLVINPSWDVPPVIAGEDLLPLLQKDAGYVARHRYQVLQGWGSAEQLLDPKSIDWSEWTADNLPYRLRQLPGPENALGRVKFMFPNRFGVYLHDTPAQGLFAAERRTFSSGCIRVAHAFDLAELLLRLDGHEDAGALLEQALASEVPQQLEFAHPVPIYIVYFTAWVDGEGVVQFRPDIYGRDAEILRALEAPLPQNAACCSVSASP